MSNNENTIVRVQKNKKSPYVMIDKTGLEDSRLSFKAKGILAYCLSRSDDWKIIVSDLVNRSADGKSAIYSGIDELQKYGYITERRINKWKTIYKTF